MRVALFVFFVLMLAPPAHAGTRKTRTVTITDLSATERALIDDARDDKLTSFDAVTGALVASKVPIAQHPKAAAKWRAFVEDASDLRPLAPHDRARALLDLLHRQLLTGRYDFDQNDMGTLLLEGSYNCVTASLAYSAAGRAIGLEMKGVLVPSHVYVRVFADGASYDVETTSKAGFMLARDDAAYREFLKTMQLENEARYGRRVASGEKFFRREIDDISLIGLLYANRGALLVREAKMKQAIGEFARSALLAQDERYARDSRDLLLAQAAEMAILDGDYREARSLFEFAVKDPGGDAVIVRQLKENIGYTYAIEAAQKLEKKDFAGAIAAYENGKKWTSDPALPHNLRAAWGQWGMTEYDAKRWEKAADVFDRARAIYPTDPDFTRNFKATHASWAQSRIEAGDCDGAVGVARRLHAALPKDPDAANVLVVMSAKCSDMRLAKGDIEGAVRVLEEAHRETHDAQLRLKVAVIWNNAGVERSKQGDRTGAEYAWRKALEADPQSEAAKSNLQRLGVR